MQSALAVLLASLLGPSQTPAAKSAPATDLRCGAYCLFVALGAVDRRPSSFEELEKRLGQPTSLGYSMQQLGDAARSFGAHSLGLETSLDNLERRPGRFACIALLEEAGHFICIYDVDAQNVYLVDPPGHRVVAREPFTKIWKGKVLLLSDSPIDPIVPGRFPIVAVVIAVSAASIGLVTFAVVRKHLHGK